jgi:ligand-binding sensor protein
MVHDITDRTRAEEALRLSEERVRRKLGSVLSPEGDLGDLELGDIIDPPAVQALLEDFYHFARVGVSLIDLKGEVLVGIGWQDICTNFHRRNPETCRHCVESDLELTRGVPPGEWRLYKCKNNLWDVATPIMVGEEHVGNLFSGQFFFEDEVLDTEFFGAQARRYGFEEEAYLSALERVPRLPRQVPVCYLVRIGPSSACGPSR